MPTSDAFHAQDDELDPDFDEDDDDEDDEDEDDDEEEEEEEGTWQVSPRPCAERGLTLYG